MENVLLIFALSYDQVRSIASDLSDMHNENGDFQYFVLDFNEESMAFHAGDILSKAVFANEALKEIRKLYSASDKQRMVAHLL